MSDFKMVPFGHLLLEPVRNGIYKQKEFHGSGAKIVNMGELFRFPRLRDVPMKRVQLNGLELDRFSLSKGDLLFARRSLTAEGAGKCTVVLETDGPTTFESSIIRAKPDPKKVSSLYLYYLFGSSLGFHLLDTIRRQVSVAGITGSDLSRLVVPIPKLACQKAVASILGALDDKIDLNRRMNETLEATARAIFKDWFIDFGPTRAKVAGDAPYLSANIWALFPDQLDDEQRPKGWSTTSLADYAVLNPESWSRLTYPDMLEYVDLAGTKWGIIETTEIHEKDTAPSRAQRILRPGDTIIGTVRPGNGSFALVCRHGLTGSTGFAVLRPIDTIAREFVYLAATQPENIERLSNLADGGAYPAIRPGVVLATQVMQCTERVLHAFSDSVRSLIDRIDANFAENVSLSAMRDLLLPKLMSGELRVRNAERVVESAL